MRAKLSLIDLVNALEATSRHIHWHVDLVTGDVLHPGAVPVAAAPARYPSLPRVGELPEAQMRRDFCERVRDADQRAGLVVLIDADVPRARFESALAKAGFLDEWVCYRRSRLAGLALAWAAAQDVTCRDVGRPTFATL